MDAIATEHLESRLLKECEEIEAFKWGLGHKDIDDDLGDYNTNQYLFE